jgi:hypothetical protein
VQWEEEQTPVEVEAVPCGVSYRAGEGLLANHG